MVQEIIQIISNQPQYSQIIAAVLAVIIGYIVARVIGKSVQTLLKRKTDSWFPEFPLSKLFKRLVEWFIYIYIVNIVLLIIGFNEMANYIFAVLVFYANAVVGIIIIIVGYFISKKAKAYFSQSLLSEAVFMFIISVSVLTALPFFGIRVELLTKIFLILLGALVLGFALSIGYAFYKNIQEALKE